MANGGDRGGGLVFWLRIAHLLAFATVGIFAWGSYRVKQFKDPNASITKHVVLTLLATLILGVVVHKICAVKTKLGYLLKLNDWPRYTLY